MNKYLRARDERSASGAPPHHSFQQPVATPRSWKAGLVGLAIVFAIYSFFGQFFLPYELRWSTISGGVLGGTEAASVETSLPAKENAARVTAKAAAEGEIVPRVQQASEIAKVEIEKQKELGALDLKFTALKAPILADQAAQSAEASLYAQCLARADAEAATQAARVASSTSGLGTTLSDIEGSRRMVSISLRKQCADAKAIREANRQQAQASIPTETE